MLWRREGNFGYSSNEVHKENYNSLQTREYYKKILLQQCQV